MSVPEPITVSVLVHAGPERAWHAFTTPADVMAWNQASTDWHCPSAHNELREGGSFSYRMEARDGSGGFDFAGTFLELTPPARLRYALGPDREVLVEFAPEGSTIRVSQSFTPEDTHSQEQQRAGWQSILENFKSHVETVAAGEP